MVMSPYSLTAESGRVAEFSETNSTGKSAGFTLRKLGGIVISIGKRRCAMVSAVCTSSAAASMLRLRSNWMVMTLVPCDDIDDIEEMPAMVESWRSMMPATDAAIVSALAPGKVAVTAMVGKSTRGSADTGSRRNPNTPKAMIVAVISVVITGRRIQSSESVIAYAPAFLVRDSTRVPSDRSNWPSVTTLSPPDRPSEITDSPWTVRSTFTWVTLAAPSLTTKTKLPFWLRWTATVGTTTASSVRMVSLVATSVPGHSVSLLLSMTPRTVIMPVAASTVFSTIATLPSSEFWRPGMVAATLDPLLLAMDSRKSTSTRCGTGNVT